jgi:hypothetical protein
LEHLRAVTLSFFTDLDENVLEISARLTRGESRMALTGRFTFRRSFWGRIVLQVEEEKRSFWARSKPFKKSWRDATLMDLAAPELRALIDLRYKPQFMTQHEYLAPETPSHEAVPIDSESNDGGTVTRSLLDGKRGGRRPFLNTKDISVELERAGPLGIRPNTNRSA